MHLTEAAIRIVSSSTSHPPPRQVSYNVRRIVARFVLDSTPDTALAKLFTTNPDGTVTLGWSATTQKPIDVSRLLFEPVLFQDYLMEGFVPYTLQLGAHDLGSELAAIGKGSNRDKYIPHQVRHFIKAAGINVLQEHA